MQEQSVSRSTKEENDRVRKMINLRAQRGLPYRLDRCSTDGFFGELARATRYSTNKRRSKGREMPDSEITGAILQEMWLMQQGLCFYSDIPMVDVSYSDWQVSVERLDPNRGYQCENVVLVAREFNGSRQWSPEKIRAVVSARAQPLDEEALQKCLQHARRKHVLKLTSNETSEARDTYAKRLQAGLRAYGRDIMTLPSRYRRVDHFEPETCRCGKANMIDSGEPCYPRHCQVCQISLGNSIRKFIAKLKRTAKNRPWPKQDPRANDFDLTTNFLLDVLQRQRGRCSYSDIPFTFKPNVDWSVSLERLDNQKGYARDNVCLVCYEFNTSAQWSKEKFEYFLSFAQRAFETNE